MRWGEDDGLVVTVRYWAGARAAAGRDEEAVDAATIGELLAAIGSRPALSKVMAASSLLVDGMSVRREDADHHLAPNSVVDVLPPFAGG